MKKRLLAVRERLAERQLDALLVTGMKNVFYLSGFTGSQGMVLIGRDFSCLLTDFRYTEQAEEESPHLTVLEIRGPQPDALSRLLSEAGVRRLGFEAGNVTYRYYCALKEKLSAVEMVPLDGLVEELRLVKDEEEIRAIEEAVELADRAFEFIVRHIEEGTTEREVSIELEFFMRREGASAAAFPFIVASGPRSSMPHGVASDRVIEKGDLVTLDFGAVLRGYNSDLTRTVVVGKPGEMQKNIYDIVLEAQLAAIEAVKPGVKASEVDRAARDVIVKYGYGENFGHSTGHGLGLDVHEGPRLTESDETVLKPGMVVTVEPGIYLPGWGGVRIEDDVLVESGGCRVLSKSPKQELLVL